MPDTRGSTRGVIVIRVPKAFAARALRTSLVVSARDFANVRCNCGKKGFKNVGIFSRRLFSVNNMAATDKNQISIFATIRTDVY